VAGRYNHFGGSLLVIGAKREIKDHVPYKAAGDEVRLDRSRPRRFGVLMSRARGGGGCCRCHAEVRLARDCAGPPREHFGCHTEVAAKNSSTSAAVNYRGGFWRLLKRRRSEMAVRKTAKVMRSGLTDRPSNREALIWRKPTWITIRPRTRVPVFYLGSVRLATVTTGG